MNKYVSVALLFGFLYTAASSPEASAESFLIRYHTLVTDAARGLRQDVEVLIFNDGLVIEKSVTNDSSIFMLRAQASSKDLTDLRRALVANRVGTLAGDCRIVNPLPVDSYDVSVTWFGKGGRFHSFAAGQGFSSPCPAPTASVLGALNDFIEKARQSPGVETVEFQP